MASNPRMRLPAIPSSIKPRRRTKSRFYPSPELQAALYVPLLLGENEAAFKQLLNVIVDAFEPTDPIEYIFAHGFVDDTWMIKRCERMKIAVVNAALPSAKSTRLCDNDRMHSYILHLRASEERSRLAELKGVPVQEVEELDPKKFVEADDFVAREDPKAKPPSDQDTVVAFQSKISLLNEIDKMQAAAEARRNNRLASMEFYRRTKLQEICERADEIIDGEASVIVDHSPAEVARDPAIPAQCELAPEEAVPEKSVDGPTCRGEENPIELSAVGADAPEQRNG